MLSIALSLFLSTVNPAPPSISLIGLDSGHDHIYCCESWRGCWAYNDDVGWFWFRQDDCITFDEWRPGSFSVWRCRCPRKPMGHLPRPEVTKHQPRAPGLPPKQQ